MVSVSVCGNALNSVLIMVINETNSQIPNVHYDDAKEKFFFFFHKINGSFFLPNIKTKSSENFIVFSVVKLE